MALLRGTQRASTSAYSASTRQLSTTESYGAPGLFRTRSERYSSSIINESA